MKKIIAVLSALLIGLSYSQPGSVAMAADDPQMAAGSQNPETTQASSADEGNSSVAQIPSSIDDENLWVKRFWKKITGSGEKEDLQKNPDSEIQQETQIGEHKTEEAPVSGIKNLQIPQKLAVIIDPWEMDGKGQVYSEPYIIRNTGDTPGILTLSNLACKPHEQSGVVVKTAKEGLHDSGDKSIYVEMMLGNGDQIVFTTEKSQYQTELNPGEELDIRFAGEVNENAFGEWNDQDVTISVVYSWETKQELDGLNLEEEQADDSSVDGQQHSDESEKESIECLQTDTNEEEPDVQKQDDAEEAEGQRGADSGEEKQGSDSQKETGKELSDPPQTDVNQENINTAESDAATSNADTQQGTFANINAEDKKEPEINYSMEADQKDSNVEDIAKDLKIDEGAAGSEEKEEIKNIDLLEPQKVNVDIDSWKVDEKDRIISQQYILYNAGDTTGSWTLSGLICKTKEQNEVRVTADKKTLHDIEGKAVYMELVHGNGEKVALSQENRTCEVKLRAGEKLTVRFIGEMKGNLVEGREEGDIAVTAVCSWDIE